MVVEDVFVPDAAVSLTRPADAWPPIPNTVIGAAMPLVRAEAAVHVGQLRRTWVGREPTTGK
ncbi:hypothetical protein OH799_02560 [Nocardia sp. NBC_00881]|uniref:hypothetical protein n=1 Tax=Nocardia sp. NBC_00881 TaxID=2975995 RepID=UPI00386BCB67|nr:hypothetical protein OH799_02560 [Nocardia sp. NBC_00881]